MRRAPSNPPTQTDDTQFGSLVDGAAALATPVGLPSIDDEEDAAEAMTVVAYEEPALPRESERRRVQTNRIRARRIEALRRQHDISLRAARLAPHVEPAPELTPPPDPAPASRPPRRPTVPAQPPPNDWAQERSVMPQRFLGTLCMAPLATHRGTFGPDARVMTMASMLLSMVAGVFLAAALATLL